MRKIRFFTVLSCFWISMMLFLFAADIGAQSPYPFVSSDFIIPVKLENEKFRLRMLTVNDVVKDYDAVMTSVDRLKKMFRSK